MQTWLLNVANWLEFLTSTSSISAKMTLSVLLVNWKTRLASCATSCRISLTWKETSVKSKSTRKSSLIGLVISAMSCVVDFPMLISVLVSPKNWTAWTSFKSCVTVKRTTITKSSRWLKTSKMLLTPTRRTSMNTSSKFRKRNNNWMWQKLNQNWKPSCSKDKLKVVNLARTVNISKKKLSWLIELVTLRSNSELRKRSMIPSDHISSTNRLNF